MSLLTITKSAIRQLYKIQTTQKKKYIFLGIKSGGCNGFDYYLDSTNTPPKKMDELYQKDKVQVIVCGKSLLYLLGTEIDYTTDIMGNRFVFTNPNAQATCGCGSSFSPKV